MVSIFARPAYTLLALIFAGILLLVGVASFALQQPWLGVQMAAVDGKVRAVYVHASLEHQIPAGAEVKRLFSATHPPVELQASDLIEEPDFFDTYEEMANFFARQSQLDALSHSSQVTLVWADEAGVESSVSIEPGRRPVHDLPAVFWFQVLIGLLGLWIASWIYLLRGDDWGARMFALTGLLFPLFTIPAAIYSTRELALDGETFRVLSSLNHTGAILFGCAFAGLFLTYPRRLVKARHLYVFFAVFSAWLAADVFRWAPNQDWGSRFPVILEMILVIVFSAIQWRKTAGHPIERAALRWLILSSVVGSSLAILSIYGSAVMGILPNFSQGYSFGFFFIMYLGIALGLRHYQLFDIDEWSYRGLLWVGGAVSVIVLDALLIYFGATEMASLGLSLLLAGWLYFPLRQWLWQRIVNKHTVKLETLLPELSRIAFKTAGEQKPDWEAFLGRVFEPLEMRQENQGNNDCSILEEGLALYIPACGSLPAYKLRHAGKGSRLFSSRDAAFANTLTHLLSQVMGGRSNYEKGVVEERLRIGRDLHDNIGARLLKLIHHLRGTSNADIARDAMKDLRTSIAALDTQPVPLLDALADWRAEAGSRCEVMQCQLTWNQAKDMPEVDLPPRMKGMLESVMREVITNALKHASPASIRVGVETDTGGLKIDVENDGDIADPLTWQDGYGLRNIRGRVEELGGNLNISSNEGSVRLTITVPLQ